MSARPDVLSVDIDVRYVPQADLIASLCIESSEVPPRPGAPLWISSRLPGTSLATRVYDVSSMRCGPCQWRGCQMHQISLQSHFANHEEQREYHFSKFLRAKE